MKDFVRKAVVTWILAALAIMSGCKQAVSVSQQKKKTQTQPHRQKLRN